MKARAIVAVVACLSPVPALAQAYQCTPPARIDPIRPVVPDGAVVRTPIGGYTLAVSWSPEICRDARDARSMQCGGADGRFGFVLHGLWPEARRGPPPQWCSLTPRPSPGLIRGNLCMTPVPQLIAHEWAKHGSCMAPTPEAYYRTSAALWQALRWPDADRLSRQQDLTVGDLRRAFVFANRGWRAGQVGVVLSRAGWLRELRLCYDRARRPAACARAKLGPPDATPLKIWRGL